MILIKPRQVKPVRTGFRLKDFIIILLCISGFIYSLNLFRLDLSQTINLKNVKPVGFVTLKQNIIQRRISDRVLWDRLAVDSPLYIGDLIRIPALSFAALDIDGQQVHLNENTLIRIQLSPDGSTIQIELAEGSLELAAGEDASNIQLNLNGRIVEVESGTALSAVVGDDGISLMVSEGSVVLNEEEGQNREIFSGTFLTVNTEDQEQQIPSVAIIRPRPNARYLKPSTQEIPINFSWNRNYLQPDDSLILEIAEDRSFTRIIRSIDNLDNSARVSLDIGQWHWRLSLKLNDDENLIFYTGRLTVLNASTIDLQSPAAGSVFRYYNNPPALRFQWSEAEEASHYIVEVSDTPAFLTLQLSSEIEATSFVQSSLTVGSWYWRVKPVFPPSFETDSAYSSVSFFVIEQSTSAEEISEINLAEPEPTAIIQTEVRLVSPADGANISALAVLREQVELRWESNRELERSRLVISRNSAPLNGEPRLVITNPNRNLRLPRLEEGTWFWTVEAFTAAGLSLVHAQPRQFEITPIPLLPAPVNIVPSNRYRFRADMFLSSRNIIFRWSNVAGANAYIFTLYREVSAAERQVISNVTVNTTNWILENVEVLNAGTYSWQVEAVSINSNGTIEQRGRLASSNFILDIPLPQVRVNRPGVLYGQ